MDLWRRLSELDSEDNEETSDDKKSPKLPSIEDDWDEDWEDLDWESLKKFDTACEEAIQSFRDTNDPQRRVNRGLVNVVPRA